jgi:hypothetical protein
MCLFNESKQVYLIGGVDAELVRQGVVDGDPLGPDLLLKSMIIAENQHTLFHLNISKIYKIHSFRQF